MGVSGSGKTTVAAALARALHTSLLDGDFLHPRANVLKMASGRPLTDEDRAPWLTALNDAAFAMARTQPVSLLVCSALKRRYRDRLREGNPTLSFVYLKGSRELIRQRMEARSGHYFTPAMLESQFAALEEPGPDETDILTVDIGQSLGEVVETILRRMGMPPGALSPAPSAS